MTIIGNWNTFKQGPLQMELYIFIRPNFNINYLFITNSFLYYTLRYSFYVIFESDTGDLYEGETAEAEISEKQAVDPQVSSYNGYTCWIL